MGTLVTRLPKGGEPDAAGRLGRGNRNRVNIKDHMRSRDVFDWIIKLLLLLLFGPVLLCAALRIVVAFLKQALPLLVALALVAGVAAGLSYAFGLRLRGARPRARNQPIPQIPPLLGRRDHDDEDWE